MDVYLSKRSLLPFVLGTVLTGLSFSAEPTNQLASSQLVNGQFMVTFDPLRGSIQQIERPGDPVHLQFLDPGVTSVVDSASRPKRLGDVLVHYQFVDGLMSPLGWRTATTNSLRASLQPSRGATRTVLSVQYATNDEKNQSVLPLSISETYELTDKGLRWAVGIRNLSQHSIKLGDVALPLPFHTRFKRETDAKEIYTHYLIRHANIAGANSQIYWTRPDGVGPYLAMTPETGTTLEYYDVSSEEDGEVFTAYVHGLATTQDLEPRGTWNQPVTDRILAQAGLSGDSVTFAFDFAWANSIQSLRDLKVSNGGLDVEVSPGMVIPNDLSALASIHCRGKIDSVVAEYPQETRVERLESPAQGRSLYRFRFARLGENNITIRWSGGRVAALEYFVTEPLAVLVKKRAAHIVQYQQVRDRSKWFDGVFSIWDMEQQTLRTPENTAGLDPYMVGGSDDPDLSKAPFLAEKNLRYPNDREIGSIEYYLREFVWGKLQRTDQEQPNPYGIYGIPNWKVSRESPINTGGLGSERMWRSYDYPHLIQLYLAMYKIGRLYPSKVHYLTAQGYLDRAFGTARAYFEVPYSIIMDPSLGFPGYNDWSYKLGTMHEAHIEELINILRGQGRIHDATWLEAEWEKKVKYFTYDSAYPFGSEMYFDTTAFQSAYAFARFGLTHHLQPDDNLWRDKNSGRWYSHPDIHRSDFQSMMSRTIAADIAARGWTEANYYQLGSDYRGGGLRGLLTYMSQLGGAPILDYGLEYADDPYAYIRLGYASQLSSWALMNTGNKSTGFGYWYPGTSNDGAAGWAFLAEKYGLSVYGTNIRQGRGAWRYDGEIDNGYSEALTTASTVVVKDPLFGLIAYGGTVADNGQQLRIWCHDEVAERIWVRKDNLRLRVDLNRDGFDRKVPVEIRDDASRLQFLIENRDRTPHSLSISIRGLRIGRYRVSSFANASYFDVRTAEETAVVSVPIKTIGRNRIELVATRR